MSARAIHKLSVLFAAIMASACANQSRVHVTEASLGQPIPKAMVVIEPNPPTPSNSPQFLAAAEAVGAELGRAGFGIAPKESAASELIAVVDYTKVDRPLARSSPSGQNAAASPGAMPGNGDIVETTALMVRLKRRSDQSVIWQGRSSIDTRVAIPSNVVVAPLAPELAAAVFKNFKVPT